MSLDGIKFKTVCGNEYEYCSKSCIVFKKGEINSEDSSKRKILWGNLCSNLSENNDYDLNVNQVEELLYRTGFRHLSLEVTEECNLRCKYCCYSEEYKSQRYHGKNNMTWDIAKKAIDWYFKSYKKAKTFNPNLTPVIGFYGGEPLLNIKLIKQCVLYAKTLFTRDDKLYITLTTNGVLLNEDIIQFFHEEDVNMIVSLDGDKVSHDRNRVLKNGQGTFDIVMNNIRKINEIRNSEVFVNSVFDLKTNLKNVFDFFDDHPNIINLNISPVFYSGTDYYEQFTDEDTNKFYEKYNDLLKQFLEIVTDENFQHRPNKIPFVVKFFGNNYCSKTLMKRPLTPEGGVIKYTGNCIPGNKVFVDTKGDFYMCEKVTRDWKIGDIQSGLDFKKILEIINFYNSATSKCKDCVIRNHCNTCFAMHTSSGDLHVNDDDCKSNITTYKESLELTYSILEKNPYWLRTYLDEYYDKLMKVGDIQGC